MPTTNQEKFETLSAIIKSNIPNFENRLKENSWLNKVIAFFVKPFNKEYSSGYITTLYPYIYWPNENTMKSSWAWEVLAHEYVHLMDYKRNNPVWFSIKYLFPQIFAVLSLGTFGAFWNLWFLFCLLFLVFLLPFPSIGRTWAEMRGYTMTMAVTIWTRGDISEYEKELIVGQFTGWSYYKMCPDKQKVMAELNKNVEAIKNGSILLPKENQVFRDVYEMIQNMK